jgi:hypothetical protein
VQERPPCPGTRQGRLVQGASSLFVGNLLGSLRALHRRILAPSVVKAPIQRQLEGEKHEVPISHLLNTERWQRLLVDDDSVLSTEPEDP